MAKYHEEGKLKGKPILRVKGPFDKSLELMSDAYAYCIFFKVIIVH